jgi:hypothetical protein
MTAKRFDQPEEGVEVTEEHVLTETGMFKQTILNMNQVIDFDLTTNILTPVL